MDFESFPQNNYKGKAFRLYCNWTGLICKKYLLLFKPYTNILGNKIIVVVKLWTKLLYKNKERPSCLQLTSNESDLFRRLSKKKIYRCGGGGIDEIVKLMDCTVYCHQYLSLLLTYPHSNISFTQISTNIKHFILKKMDPLN